MHVVFMTRGNYTKVREFIEELRTRYLPYKRVNPLSKGKLEDAHIQMRVSPVQLWDISFPKSSRDAVLNTIFPQGPQCPGTKKINKFLGFIRLALGLKKSKDWDTSKYLLMKPIDSVETILIGERDDYWIEPDGSHSDEKNKSDNAYEGI